MPDSDAERHAAAQHPLGAAWVRWPAACSSHVPMKIGKLDVNPLVNTFVSTCVSGFTFAALSVYINVVSVGGDFAVAMAAYVAIVLGTATFNCIFVEVLATPLKKVLKR
ncbi:MAG: hypothetical protein ACLTDR_16305 [Adlercreutzia equolifaciens]